MYRSEPGTVAKHFSMVAVFLAVFLGSEARSQSILRPQGLEPGDAYRLIFLTADRRNALSSNIDDYNAFVRDQARSPESLVRSLDTEWAAIASTSQVDAITNTQTDPSAASDNGVPIYLLDGATRFAEDYSNLWDDSAPFSLYLGALDLTQFGEPVGVSNLVWTGTRANGRVALSGGPLGSDTPTGGLAFFARNSSGWVEGSPSRPGELRALYALSSVLIAIPEPTSVALLVCVTSGFLAAAGRQIIAR